MTNKKSSYLHQEDVSQDGRTLTMKRTSDEGIEAYLVFSGRTGDSSTVIPHWAMREIYEFIRRQDWEYTAPSRASSLF